MRDKIFYGWWIVGACFLLNIYVGGVLFFGFTAFFEPIREEFGWSYAQISLASSLRGMEMGIMAPFVGILVDRFGSRRLMIMGTVAMGLGLVVLSATTSLVTFYAAFLLLAFGAGGCTSVVSMTVVASWFYKRLGIAMGIMVSGFGASGVLVPIIVRLIDSYGWRVTFIVLGVGLWGMGIPMSLIIRNTPEECGWGPDGTRSIPEPSATKDEETRDRRPLKTALGKRTFWYLNIAEAIRMLSVTAVVTHVMPYLSSIGISRAVAGMVAAGIPLCSIAGRFGLGWLSDYTQKRHVMALSFFLLAMGMLTFGYVEILWLFIPFLFFFPSGLGGSMVVRGTILRESFGRESFGTLLGITLGSASIGGIIGPTFAGWAFDVTGSYHGVWIGCCVLLFLTIGLILRIR